MRIMVVGTSGAGKTTMGRRLSQALGIPQVELDALNWEPGWRDLTKHDLAKFVRRVEQVAATEAWITDGSYTGVWPILAPRSDHIIWLDYSRSVIMPRIVRRSISRAISGRELWPGSGNREYLSDLFAADHIIRWAWTTWADRRKRYEAIFADPAYARLTVHRLRHPRQAQSLIATLAG